MKNEEIVVYEVPWIIRRIYEVSDNLRSKVVDQTKFEERCIKKIARYIVPDAKRMKHKRYIERLIQREAKCYIDESKKEHGEIFSSLVDVGEDGEEIEFEPIDVLANVESEVMAKEITALLAQDGRRKIVLDAWIIGNTNGKSISRTLARTFGGNVESHRKFIQRFEKECSERLSAVI